MADLGDTFYPDQIPEDERSFDPLPAGQYKVQVVDSEVQDLKTGNGQALVLTLEVVDGQFANRKLWDRLNIRHTNEQAQSIAQRALADLFLATGTPPSRDSADLHFKPCLVTVKIDPPKDVYSAKNSLRGYKPAGGVAHAPPKGSVTAAARTASTAPAAGARPWARKTA